MTRPLTSADVTRIQTELTIKEAFHMNDDPNDTSYDNPFGLTTVEPIPVLDPQFNRETRRYAKKHKITLEQAFKKVTRRTKR